MAVSCIFVIHKVNKGFPIGTIYAALRHTRTVQTVIGIQSKISKHVVRKMFIIFNGQRMIILF
jgi:hypothetical protein